MDMKKKKKRKLGAIAMLSIVVFSVLIMVATSLVVVIQYRQSAIKSYSDQAFSYAKSAAVYIDGDKVTKYIQTGETDDYYDEIERYLSVIQENSGLKYYYVFIPQEEDLVYVWDTDEEQLRCGLGEHEDYMKHGKEASMMAFQQEPEEKILISRDEVYGYIASAFYPIFDSNGDPVALVGVDYSMPGINKSIRGFLTTISVSLLVVIAGFTVGFYLFLKQQILVPIQKLSRATKDLVNNLGTEKKFEINIHASDEIEGLSHSFESMYGEICDYIKEVSEVTAEKERIGAELNVATDIQASMLPRIFPPFAERKEFDLYASMNPAKEVGGDFYDFFLVDEDHLALVIADVSGKGVPAALFMVIAKTLIKNQAQTGVSPKQVLENVNNQLCENNEADMFVTAWLGIYEISTHTMTAANAGHEFPAIRRKDGSFELFKDPHGLVLAYIEDFSYKEYTFELNEGDTLFVYTDGVAEATNSNNELYGTDRMLHALNQSADSGADAQRLLKDVRSDIDGFVQDAPQFDDITMLALDILK